MKDDFETDINKEIITCLFDYLFILIKGSYNINFLILCSYLELFNEEISNLLVKNHLQKLVLREVSEIRLLGIELKVIKGHKMNEKSSLIHCIFTIIVEKSTKDEKVGDHIKKGKLNIVELTGAERKSKIKEINGADELKKETININYFKHRKECSYVR